MHEQTGPDQQRPAELSANLTQYQTNYFALIDSMGLTQAGRDNFDESGIRLSLLIDAAKQNALGIVLPPSITALIQHLHGPQAKIQQIKLTEYDVTLQTVLDLPLADLYARADRYGEFSIELDTGNIEGYITMDREHPILHEWFAPFDSPLEVVQGITQLTEDLRTNGNKVLFEAN